MSIHQDLICSGYSNGAVVVWETGDRDNNVSYRELMTPDSQGNKPQVTATAVNSTLCTSGFNNGNNQAVKIDIKMLGRPNYKYYKINVEYTALYYFSLSCDCSLCWKFPDGAQSFVFCLKIVTK